MKKKVPVPAGSGIRILLIDDDPFMNGLYKLGLERNGFEMVSVFDGFEGIKKAAEIHPDIILLDLMMPQIDGFETLKRLKADPKTKDLPVIILSTLSQSADVQRAMEAGAKSYFVKTETLPVEAAQKIHDILGR